MTKEVRTRIVGIVNLTPDSFSDGGRHIDAEAAIAHMEKLVEDGADVLDIGAESTRPGARALSHEEEWQRLAPVVQVAKSHFPHTVLSVDTRNAATASKALDNGADWINDVSGGQDPQMLEVIRQSSCCYVAMHALSIPADPKVVLPRSVDAAITVHSWAERRMQELYDAGIEMERLILDPGIGFGKTAEQSWHLLRSMPMLMRLPVPLLIGHSRKSFFKLVGEREAVERDMETHCVSTWLAQCGVPYIRVHDVAGAKRAIAVGRQLTQQKKEKMHE